MTLYVREGVTGSPVYDDSPPGAPGQGVGPDVGSQYLLL